MHFGACSWRQLELLEYRLDNKTRYCLDKVTGYFLDNISEYCLDKVTGYCLDNISEYCLDGITGYCLDITGWPWILSFQHPWILLVVGYAFAYGTCAPQSPLTAQTVGCH